MKLNLRAMSKSVNNNHGFTLVEATIAIAVLLIGLLAVMEFFPFALRIIGDSQNITVAANASLAKLEELQSLSYDEIPVGTIEVKQRVSTDPNNYLYQFQRQTVVETIDSDFNSSAIDVGLKKITVTTFWPSQLGADEKSYEINHVISDF